MLTKVIQLNATPARIEFDFEGAKNWLDAELERYENVVVTIDSVRDDKKLAQEIRSKARDISRARIDTKKALSEPISEFEDKMKQLENSCTELADNIAEQVRSFEQVRLDNLREMLHKERSALRTKMGVGDRYFIAEFDDLVKLGSLTAKDALTAAAKRTLEDRVRTQELDLQNKVDRRLLELENACLRAGMDAPMTRENVEAFLYDDDEDYSKKLDLLISSELRRQKDAQEAHERRMKEQMEREARQKAEAEQAAIRAKEQAEAQPEPASEPEPEPEPGPQPEQLPDIERETRTVTLAFTVQVKPGTPSSLITAHTEKLLSQVGIESVEYVEVTQ